MNSRFDQLTGKYSQLRIAVVGDFCLDRYLEIDPAKSETSIETGLPVYNVTKVRAQPGGAGTIVNNLSALGIGQIYPVGFCGTDGEGFELRQALLELPQVNGSYFFSTAERRTFTYCKPLVVTPDKPPVELNRFDSKNWTPTPAAMQGKIIGAVRELYAKVDALIFLDQVDVRETGVVSAKVLDALETVIKSGPNRVILADSRRRLKDFPRCGFKVNRKEFCAMTKLPLDCLLEDLKEKAVSIARKQSRRVFVTLSEEGILGAEPDGTVEHVPAVPVHGPIDIVGAGDAVIANLASSLAGGGTMRESLEMASAAASIVIHQLGTTGTANLRQIGEVLRK